ncbi:MAG: hypothetical protein ABI318_17805 [Chthoniobacteraceae bacterium]
MLAMVASLCIFHSAASRPRADFFVNSPVPQKKFPITVAMPGSPPAPQIQNLKTQNSRDDRSLMCAEFTDAWIPQKMIGFSRVFTASARSKCEHGRIIASDFCGSVWRV